MDEFITIQEAINLTEKSYSTIKRWIEEVQNKNTSQDEIDRFIRKEETKTGKTKFKYLINKEYLLKKAKKNNSKEPKQISQKKEGELINSLQDQIEYLKKQIEIKDLQNDKLNERLREAHIIMLEQQKTIDKLPIPSKKEDKKLEG